MLIAASLLTGCAIGVKDAAASLDQSHAIPYIVECPLTQY